MIYTFNFSRTDFGWVREPFLVIVIKIACTCYLENDSVVFSFSCLCLCSRLSIYFQRAAGFFLATHLVRCNRMRAIWMLFWNFPYRPLNDEMVPLNLSIKHLNLLFFSKCMESDTHLFIARMTLFSYNTITLFQQFVHLIRFGQTPQINKLLIHKCESMRKHPFS